MIEKDLIGIILTGKKLFSKDQIFYKYYLDPNEQEEKTQIFTKFIALYDSEPLTDEDKTILSKQIEDDSKLKQLFLQNLEILISYLLKENKYQGTQSISDIKFHSNLYLNQTFIQIFKNFNNLTINKLISIYEYMEQLLWKFIANRYINQDYRGSGFVAKNKEKIDNFIDNERKRELKNEMLISLLIKFICRNLTKSNEEIQKIKGDDLFKTIQEKNINLPQGIRDDLLNLKKEIGAEVIYAFELTDYLVGKIMGNKNSQKKNVEIKNTFENNENNINEKTEKVEEEEQAENDEEEDERDL